MRPEFAANLRCPARDCGASNLRVEATAVETVSYRTGPAQEVREGALVCPQCGRYYPIEGYVPSFEQLFPTELEEEARYWSDWYGFFWERGFRSFGDLRVPPVPFIARGIEVPAPNSNAPTLQDLPGTHQMLASHPLVCDADHILDVGCGCGWSSLFLARHGHQVTAFDPCAGNVRRAKQYAIEQGEYIEYIVAGLGFLDFEPGVFDGVFALHSLHHVPGLCGEMSILRDWLREGGVIAIDEHVQTDYVLCAVRGEMEGWFERQVAPHFRTLPIEELGSLPKAASSRMEDAGSADLLEALSCNFSIECFDSRFVSLDQFSFMYYLRHDCDHGAFAHASEMVDQLYASLKREHPERVEYITLLGSKSDRIGPATEGLCRLKGLLEQAKTEREFSAEMERSDWTKLEMSSANRELKKLWAAYGQATQSVESLSTRQTTLQATLAGLQETLHTKNEHIKYLESVINHLEAQVSAGQAALDKQTDLLERIESGRTMRLLNLLTKS